MGTRRWALGALLLWLGCGGDNAPRGDAGASDAGGTDAAAPVCPASATPGCQATCQFFYDCVVRSSLADRLGESFAEFGFSGPSYTDCSGCIARCEAGSGDEEPLACFSEQASLQLCSSGGADPTIAAQALNQCCDGKLDSTFCRQSCEATASLDPNVFPACRPFLLGARPSSCAGACPAVTSATAVSVQAEGSWRLQSAAFDPTGQVAIAGYYANGTIDVGAGPLAAADSNAVSFVAVLRASGATRWSVRLGENKGIMIAPGGGAFANPVAFDTDGNVLALTTVIGDVDLGGGSLAAQGGTDVLLASFTPDGSLRWAHRFGGPGDDDAAELTVNGTDVVITARFRETADFGGNALTSAGGSDVAVARFDVSGQHLWSRRFGSTVDDTVLAVSVHPSGDYTLTGGIGDGADLGDGPVSVMGTLDSYVARFADDGALRWAAVHSGTEGDFGYELTANGEDVMVADYFGDGDFTFDYGSERVSGLSQVAARYAADGSIPWAFVDPYGMDDDGAIFIAGFAVSNNGRIAMAAGLSETVDFGGGALTSAGGLDPVIVSFDANGTFRWSMRMGNALPDGFPFVGSLASGELIAAGSFEGGFDYGSGVLDSAAPAIFILHLASQ